MAPSSKSLSSSGSSSSSSGGTKVRHGYNTSCNSRPQVTGSQARAKANPGDRVPGQRVLQGTPKRQRTASECPAALRPFAPTPHAGNVMAPPLDVGPTFLVQLFHRFFDRSTDEDVRDFEAWLHHEMHLSFDMATACSGTDSPVLVWEAFAACVLERFGFRPQVVHKYSCERCPRKREFIREVAPNVERLFCEATLLGHESHDVFTEQSLPTPPSDFLFAGFPCTDASRLNKYHVNNKVCVQQGTLRTGSVFQSLSELAGQKGMVRRALVLENVTSLADTPEPKHRGAKKSSTDTGLLSNLTAAAQALRERDYLLVPLQLTPTLFGVPQQRARLWMPALHRALCVGKGHFDNDEQVIKKFQAAACRVTGSQLMDMNEFLLPENSPIIEEARRAAVRCDDTTAGGRERSTWKPAHAAEYRRLGLEKPSIVGPDVATLLVFPTLRGLTVREHDLLYLSGIRDFPELEARCMDLSQSVQRRGRVSKGFVHCLTPKGRFYLTQRCRFLHGIEALRLQSIYLADAQRITRAFSSAFLRDLAGNAFEASCCAMTFFITCIVLSKGAAARHAAQCSSEQAGRVMLRPPPAPVATLPLLTAATPPPPPSPQSGDRVPDICDLVSRVWLRKKAHSTRTAHGDAQVT